MLRVGTGSCAMNKPIQASQGALQLDIELESTSMRVTKHYVIYPQTSVIREWLTLENISGKPVRLTQRRIFPHPRTEFDRAGSPIQLPDRRGQL